jgi:hypothetical protein
MSLQSIGRALVSSASSATGPKRGARDGRSRGPGDAGDARVNAFALPGRGSEPFVRLVRAKSCRVASRCQVLLDVASGARPPAAEAGVGVSDDVVQHRGDRPKPGDADFRDERDLSGRRNYVWPSFEKNNLMAVRHGAGSERIVSRLAEQLVDWVTREHPDLKLARYRFSVAAWARAESVVGLLTAYLDDHDVIDGDGEVREKLLAQLRAAERRASEERRELGLSPAAHAALEKRRAEAVRESADLGELRARGQAALDRGDVKRLGRVDGVEGGS